MTFAFGRRPLVLGALAALGATALAGTDGSIAAAASAPGATPEAAWQPQVAFLNHTYTVLDRETADAVAESSYLREFGSFQLRTTSGSEGTYTGRYLLGRETYLEMFGPGDLPSPDDRRGASGLAVSPDRAGGLDVVTRRLAALGVTDPLKVAQTKEVDGTSIPWFDVVAVSPTYVALFPWVMEYRQSYFDDPRTHSEPARYPGDVSRERYNPDDYRQHLMRDVTGVEIDLPHDDIEAAIKILRAAGYDVRPAGHGVVARGGGATITLVRAPRDRAGWRRLDLALTRSTPRHVERIGNSTLVVGPGPSATWTFD